MKVNRVIGVYERTSDKHIKDVSLNEVSIDRLKEIMNPSVDDPDLYMIYKINIQQYQLLVNLVPLLSDENFDNSDMYYECNRVTNG